MAPSFIRSESTERRFARVHEHALSQVARLPFLERHVYSDFVEGKMASNFPGLTNLGLRSRVRARSTDDDTAIKENIKLPGTAAGLIGVCTLIGVSIFLVLSWKLYFRRKKKQSANRHLFPSTIPSEKYSTRNVILTPSVPHSPQVVWEPVQVSPWVDSKFPKRPPTILSRNSVASTATCIDEKRLSNLPQHLVSPKTPGSNTKEKGPISPLLTFESSATGKIKDSLTNVPSPIFDDKATVEATRPCPQQFNSHTRSDQAYVRLVVVIQTFPISMSDELEVTIGETLRLIQEFQDGWCICERTIFDNKMTRGVVPLCCLAEHIDSKNVETSQPGHSLKTGVLNEHSTQQKLQYLKRSQSLGAAGGSIILGGKGPRQHHLNPRIIRIA